MPWWLIMILIVAGCFVLAFAMMIPMGMAIGGAIGSASHQARSTHQE